MERLMHVEKLPYRAYYTGYGFGIIWHIRRVSRASWQAISIAGDVKYFSRLRDFDAWADSFNGKH